MITNPKIEDYCRKHSTAMPTIFDKLIEQTQKETTAPQMQVGPLEGKFLQFLVRIQKAQHILEIGTFTGYSSLAMALALEDNGKIVTCDVDPRTTKIAQEFWTRAGVQDKISLRLGPAIETIVQLPDNHFDIVFIDADKANYFNYWQSCYSKLRTGGLIVVDNVLWKGRILDPVDTSDKAIAHLNDFAKKDTRFEVLMLPIRDGILLARKLTLCAERCG